MGLAQSIDGNTLYAACSAENQDVQLGFCVGYIGGTWDGLKLGSSISLSFFMEENTIQENDIGSNAILSVCMPPNVENIQIIDVFTLYLEANPAIRHETARLLLLLSLQEAFPCDEFDAG